MEMIRLAQFNQGGLIRTIDCITSFCRPLLGFPHVRLFPLSLCPFDMRYQKSALFRV
jgi:hypothetical protein